MRYALYIYSMRHKGENLDKSAMRLLKKIIIVVLK